MGNIIYNTLKHTTMKRIIISGRAASGKDFLRNHLVKAHQLEQEVSLTTRPMRDGEINGETYHFVPRYVFEDLMYETGGYQFFFENVEFNGERYGTSMRDWESKDVFIFYSVRYITDSRVRTRILLDRLLEHPAQR